MSLILDRAAAKMDEMFPTLPWKVRFTYKGESVTTGSGPEEFHLECRKEAVVRDLACGDLFSVLDRYVAGDVDFSGSMYKFVGCRKYVRSDGDWKVGLLRSLKYVAGMLAPTSVRRKFVSVSSHYDLPNEFILSYLDTRTRAYSCAIWKDPMDRSEPFDEPLEDAQHRKFHHAASELQLQPGDKFLDIGCGYGYMVRLAETEFGVKDALGITLSQNQIDEGFSKNLKLKHYHELPADSRYDKIYTCGMVSHLDRAELRRYYRHVYDMLKSGGSFWMHGIVPPANRYGMNNYNSLSGTFSQKYVFPDHYQFPVHMHLQAMEDTGFRVRKIHFRYGHYAKTLWHWYKRFVDNLPKTRHLITPIHERAWHLYLTYASVMDGPESVVKQILATKT